MTRSDAPTMNPLVLQRADPCVLRHEGQYYFTASHPLYDRIILRRAETLDGLQAADEATIWRKHDQGPQSELIWAPEIHRVHGAWYIYYAAALTRTAPRTPQHRRDLSTIGCSSSRTLRRPFAGEWVERGQVDTGWESFARTRPASCTVSGRPGVGAGGPRGQGPLNLLHRPDGEP